MEVACHVERREAHAGGAWQPTRTFTARERQAERSWLGPPWPFSIRATSPWTVSRTAVAHLPGAPEKRRRSDQAGEPPRERPEKPLTLLSRRGAMPHS
jgi:hypothetical protein